MLRLVSFLCLSLQIPIRIQLPIRLQIFMYPDRTLNVIVLLIKRAIIKGVCHTQFHSLTSPYSYKNSKYYPLTLILTDLAAYFVNHSINVHTYPLTR